MKPFMTTEWLHLAMVNYEVDPAILQPLVPHGTELDDSNGRMMLSMVGFLYRDTRVLGLAIPGHRSFAEVNLRYYIRYRADDGWRRGVAFIKEIVPRRAVSLVARWLYDENFVTHPMRYALETDPHDPTRITRAEYSWKHAGAWQRLAVETKNKPERPEAGSEAEFITEHYWGYTARRDGTTSEYCVEHPQWKIAPASHAVFDCDIESIYGQAFIESLSSEPSSAFLVDGSAVNVYPGKQLAHSYVQRYAVSSSTLS